MMKRKTCICTALSIFYSVCVCWAVSKKNSGATTPSDAAPSAATITCKERGDAFVDKGQLDQAIEAYTETLRISPQYAEAYYSRGFPYGKKAR